MAKLYHLEDPSAWHRGPVRRRSCAFSPSAGIRSRELGLSAPPSGPYRTARLPPPRRSLQ